MAWSVQAQDLLIQDFSDDQMPPTGWSIDAHAGNWSTQASANAGGEAPEARFSWTPQFTGETYLISPEIDLTGYTTVAVEFKHMVDHYGGSYTLGLVTRSGGGDWNTVWELVNPPASIEGETVLALVDNDDVGATDFQFAFFFSGNSYNINYWYLDDFLLFAPYGLDIAMKRSLIPEYIAQGDHDVMGVVANVGLTAITSFDVTWQLDSGQEYLTSYDGLGLGFGDTYTFTADDMVSLLPGDHILDMWVSDVNESDDNNTGNDSLTQVIHTATAEVQRKPLFEEFTSSTCAPCSSFNANVLHPLLEANEDKYSLVKYQMDWPGSGDPYYTEEGGVRRYYYGVAFVPFLVTDGGEGAETQNAFDVAYETPAFFSIDAGYDMDGTVIHIVANIMPFVNFTDFTIQIAVIENMTTGNVGSNGETEFHNVMMKMVPDASGTMVSGTAGELVTLEYTQDLNGTFVEEWDDLSVVVFIQNDATKDVFQSGYATIGVGIEESLAEGSFRVYPNPVDEMATIQLNLTERSRVQAVVYNINGQEVKTLASGQLEAGNQSLNWNRVNNKGNLVDPGIYFLKLIVNDRAYTSKLTVLE